MKFKTRLIGRMETHGQRSYKLHGYIKGHFDVPIYLDIYTIFVHFIKLIITKISLHCLLNSVNFI